MLTSGCLSVIAEYIPYKIEVKVVDFVWYCRAEAALAEAIHSRQHVRSNEQLVAQHTRRRRKAAANPVSRLEEDLLQASRGLEAELYEDL